MLQPKFHPHFPFKTQKRNVQLTKKDFRDAVLLLGRLDLDRNLVCFEDCCFEVVFKFPRLTVSIPTVEVYSLNSTFLKAYRNLTNFWISTHILYS